MRFILIVVIFCCIVIPIQSQYINPPFAGSSSDGAGAVGALESSYSYGYLNPAGCFTDYPRINISTYTGWYSDWFLHIPTIKNVSVRYPIVLNRLSSSFSYSIPQDNHLKYSVSHNPLDLGSDLNVALRKQFAFILAYHPNVSTIANNLDLFIGANVSKYWTAYISYPVDNYFGSGVYFRGGLYAQYHLFPKLKFDFAGVVQPNSVFYSNDVYLPGFYVGSAGVIYYLNLENNEYLKLGSEILMPLLNESKTTKLSVGLKYHFPTLKNNSIQCGVFSYSVDPYSQYKPVIWNTVGLSYELKYFAFSIAMMDAINLNTKYRKQNDTSKIFSLSLDIPFKIKKKISFGDTKQPIFRYFKYKSFPIKIKESKSIDLYVRNDGIDTLKSAKIFTNVLPQNGLFIPDRTIDIGHLAAGQIKKVTIPIEAINGYLTQKYLLKAECFYRPDASRSIEIPVQTIEPVLNVSLKMKPYKQILAGYVPGIFVIEVKVNNSGNMTADSLVVKFPENLVSKGIIKKADKVIPHLPPGSEKSVEYFLEFPDTIRNQSLPLNIVFEEKDGYVPEPYYTSIQLINRGNGDKDLLKIDPFTQGFKYIDRYVIVVNGNMETLKQLSFYQMSYDNHFPGKLVIGPFNTFKETYDNFISVSQIVKTAEIYGITDNRIESINRFFISIEKNDINTYKLLDLEIAQIYTSTLDTGVLLVGPFKSLLDLRPLLSFFEKNFNNVTVQSLYPNEVEILNDISE